MHKKRVKLPVVKYFGQDPIWWQEYRKIIDLPNGLQLLCHIYEAKAKMKIPAQ